MTTSAGEKTPGRAARIDGLASVGEQPGGGTARTPVHLHTSQLAHLSVAGGEQLFGESKVRLDAATQFESAQTQWSLIGLKRKLCPASCRVARRASERQR